MLRFETAGESHGECLVATLTGLPAGVPVSLDTVNHELWRRQQGYGRGGRMKIEHDRAEIVSGVRHSHTIGSPVAILIRNHDWQNWTAALPVEDMDCAEDKKKPATRRCPWKIWMAPKIRRSPSPAPAPDTPTWQAPSSTISMTRATFWSGPARAKPRPAWPSARLPRHC